MKICFISNEYPSGKTGGIGIFTKELAEALVKRGHKVYVVGLFDENDEIVENGVHLIKLKRLKGKLSFFKNSKLLEKTINYLIKNEKLDLVEIPDFEGNAAFWKLNIPIVSRLHGSVTYFAREMNQKESLLTYWIEKKSLQNSNYICSVSKYTAKKTKEIFRFNKDIKIIYNGVKISDKYKNNYKNNFIVSFSGSLMRKKGVLSLAKAWNIVKQKIPQAKLRFIGKDTFENGKSIKEKIINIVSHQYRDSLIFTGHISKEELEDLLIQSDIAIYPSYAEAFSLAPIEAASLGLPVIYSVYTSGKELKEKINSIDLIDPNNIEDIANQIIFLLKNESIREEKGKKNRELAIKNFDINKKIDENLEFYKEIANG